MGIRVHLREQTGEGEQHCKGGPGAHPAPPHSAAGGKATRSPSRLRLSDFALRLCLHSHFFLEFKLKEIVGDLRSALPREDKHLVFAHSHREIAARRRDLTALFNLEDKDAQPETWEHNATHCRTCRQSSGSAPSISNEILPLPNTLALYPGAQLSTYRLTCVIRHKSPIGNCFLPEVIHGV